MRRCCISDCYWAKSVLIAPLALSDGFGSTLLMGWTAPDGIKECQTGVVSNQAREPSVQKASTIGLDLAKNVFQVHGADEAGAVVFRIKLRRDKLLAFFADHPPCVVAMEACASSNHWAREIAKLGHQTRLIAAHSVKPFVKRQKNDAADAEAICEAALRPSMRFVRVKTEDEQASAIVFRARDLLVRQRTQIINALRGHLTEYGIVAPALRRPCPG